MVALNRWRRNGGKESAQRKAVSLAELVGGDVAERDHTMAA
jgi:hypothetical protein